MSTDPASLTLKEKLGRQNLKWNWDSIAAECVANPKRLIPSLLKHCTDPETAIQQNAGAVLGKIIDFDKQLLIPHLPKILNNLKAAPHDAVKRATMRVLQSIDVAIRYVSDHKEAIAIRAFSITVARRICQRYPSLRHEVLPVVRGMLEQKSPPGIIARAKREVKLLEAMSDLNDR